MSSALKRSAWLSLAGLLLSVTVGAADDLPPERIVERAMSEARGIPAQATALVGLTWPSDGTGDPMVQTLAREQLVHFGNHSLAALRVAIKQVDPRYQADATATLIGARRRQQEGNPPNYLPALDDAIWFGSIEARRLAMIEITRYRHAPVLLSIIDAIYENPELTATGLRALSEMRDGRARFFLESVVTSGEPRFRKIAADGLADVGEAGLAILRELTESDNRQVREAAMAALLPRTRLEDLTLLYEYITRYGEDDALILDAIRGRAMEFETLLEQMEYPDEPASEEEGS